MSIVLKLYRFSAFVRVKKGKAGKLAAELLVPLTFRASRPQSMENAGVSRRPGKIWLIWKFSLKASCSQKSARLLQGDLFPGKMGIAQLPSVFHGMIVALCMRAKGGKGFGSANLCGAGTVG